MELTNTILMTHKLTKLAGEITCFTRREVGNHRMNFTNTRDSLIKNWLGKLLILAMLDGRFGNHKIELTNNHDS
jgi:hypothetical protein